MNDVDVGVRQDAVGCAALLFYHYPSASHDKIYKHLCENLPPLPDDARAAEAAYDPLPDPRDASGGDNGGGSGSSGGGQGGGGGGQIQHRGGGHRHFLAPCYQAFLGRGGAAVHCREALEASSLACRAALAVAATRAADVLAALAAAPNSSSSSSPGHPEPTDCSPLPSVALKCCADLVAFAASRHDLRASAARALAQLATGLG